MHVFTSVAMSLLTTLNILALMQTDQESDQGRQLIIDIHARVDLSGVTSLESYTCTCLH